MRLKRIINELVRTAACLLIYDDSKTTITHLFLAQSVDNIAGTKEDHQGELPKLENLMNPSQNQSEPASLVIKMPPMETTRIPNSCLIKEEPPDAPRLTKPPPFQGKTQDSRNRMKANSLSLGADFLVSRSKLFQERGYDADIQPSIDYGASHNHLRRPEKTPKPCPDQIKLKNNSCSPTTTLNTFLAQLLIASKWNHPNQSSHEEVIQFTNQVFPNLPGLDLRALFEDFRLNQKDLGHKPTCYVILIHQRISDNWIHIKPRSDVKVIQLLNRLTLGLPYLEAHGYSHLQTRLWRPGETLSQSEETLYHSGESANTFQCTSIHKIRRISLYSYFPYMAAFTLYDLTLQRLYLCYSYNLGTDSANIDVPRHHTFMEKLSRLKHNSCFLT